MRKIALVNNEYKEIKRVLIHETNEDVYLFLFNTRNDGPAIADYWYKTIEEADKACEKMFDIHMDLWEYIDDPKEGCQQDWIAPVRVKGRNIGNPEWGKFEKLEEDGNWHEVPLNN